MATAQWEASVISTRRRVERSRRSKEPRETVLSQSKISHRRDQRGSDADFMNRW